MLPFVEAIHYIIQTYNRTARGASIFRDEDVMLPNSYEDLTQLEPREIFDRLQDNVDRYEGLPKSDGPGVNKQNKDFIKCYKLVQALMMIVMYIFDNEVFLNKFFPSAPAVEAAAAAVKVPEEEKVPMVPVEGEDAEAAATAAKKKKKKNKKKGGGGAGDVTAGVDGSEAVSEN